jgi:DNA-binding transcriptional regulator YiaG
MTNTPGRAVTPAEIRGILSAHKLTQAQLAAALRINRITLLAWLRGSKHPSAAHRAALESLMGPDQ